MKLTVCSTRVKAYKVQNGDLISLRDDHAIRSKRYLEAQFIIGFPKECSNRDKRVPIDCCFCHNQCVKKYQGNHKINYNYSEGGIVSEEGSDKDGSKPLLLLVSTL